MRSASPGFFRRACRPRCAGGAARVLSFYDTAPLKRDAGELVDFDRINRGDDAAVSVGAVNVRTGNSVYFDNSRMRTIGRSTSWPAARCRRAFRRRRSTASDYWDGGIVSNTPLWYVLDDAPRHATR